MKHRPIQSKCQLCQPCPSSLPPYAGSWTTPDIREKIPDVRVCLCHEGKRLALSKASMRVVAQKVRFAPHRGVAAGMSVA
jgi:hypothetical protein